MRAHIWKLLFFLYLALFPQLNSNLFYMSYQCNSARRKQGSATLALSTFSVQQVTLTEDHFLARLCATSLLRVCCSGDTQRPAPFDLHHTSSSTKLQRSRFVSNQFETNPYLRFIQFTAQSSFQTNTQANMYKLLGLTAISLVGAAAALEITFPSSDASKCESAPAIAS